MDKVKNSIVKSAKRVKKHVDDHRYAIMGALALTTVTAVMLQQGNLKLFYAFLEEKGIDPAEYYNPDLFVDLND